MRFLSSLFCAPSSGSYDVAAAAAPDPSRDKLDGLQRTLDAVRKQWDHFELSRDGHLHVSLRQLALDLGTTSERTSGRIDAGTLHELDRRLESLKAEALDVVAERGAMINARQRWQSRANVTRFETASHLSSALLKEQRALDAWSAALRQR